MIKIQTNSTMDANEDHTQVGSQPKSLSLINNNSIEFIRR